MSLSVDVSEELRELITQVVNSLGFPGYHFMSYLLYIMMHGTVQFVPCACVADGGVGCVLAT
jgi:hypothetical protein